MIDRVMRILLAAFVLSLPAGAGAAPGEYFVSLTGSDSAAGTAAAPWRTLQHAANVVAPGDRLDVTNRSASDEVDVITDGRSVGALAPEGSMPIRFADRQALLAQAPGATFYHRLRDKFGRLSY